MVEEMYMGVAEKKVLFVTAHREHIKEYDYWGQNVSRRMRYYYHNSLSYGLRFLKKNIPEINILEYPTYEEYLRELSNGYDIVGFSFYTYEVPKILKMIEAARAMGVPEIWGGNYGVLTYGVEEHFDKIFTDYAEHQVAAELNVSIDKIKHPIIIERVKFPLNIGAFPTGILFTSRGCTNKCTFCQTPVFCDGTSTIPLESIEEIVKTYRLLGVEEVLIGDETFGLYKEHSEKVTEILHRYGINWYPMTRIDFLDKRIDQWYEKGLAGTLIGIESFRQQNLNDIGKKLDIEQTERVLIRLEELNLFTIGYYIIGFEDDTEESIKQSIEKLKGYSIDMLQLCILTPLPNTPLWDHIEKNYGIFEKDWSKWNTKHLVWDHPNFTPKELENLLAWSFQEAYPHKRFIQSPKKYFSLRKKRTGSTSKAIKKLVNDMIKANTKLKRALPP